MPIDDPYRSTIENALRKCGGKRVPTGEQPDGLVMRKCLRCWCTSAYANGDDEDRDCPVLRDELWTPRPTSDGSWSAESWLPLFQQKRVTHVARASRCGKSKRGAIAVDARGDIVGLGFNEPPGDRCCSGDDACRAACGKLCIHAEAAALALVPDNVRGPIEIIHVKVVDGEPVPGGGPSCWQCARDMLADGRVAAVWLLHDSGWRRYPIVEFYELTMIECGLPVLQEGRQ